MLYRREWLCSQCLSGKVDLVEVVSSKGSITLRALALSGLITSSDTLCTEDMETLREDRVLPPTAAARAVELCLGGGGGGGRGGGGRGGEGSLEGVV